MEVVIRKDGSLRVKFDGDQTNLGLRVVVEGENEEEKVESIKSLIKRLQKYKTVIGTCYKLSEKYMEFIPVRRTRNGALVEDYKRNIGYFTVEEITNWLSEKETTKTLLKKALDKEG